MFLILEKTTNNNHTIAQIKVSIQCYRIVFLQMAKKKEKENKIKLKAEVLNPDLMLRLGLAKQNFMII